MQVAWNGNLALQQWHSCGHKWHRNVLYDNYAWDIIQPIIFSLIYSPLLCIYLSASATENERNKILHANTDF